MHNRLAQIRADSQRQDWSWDEWIRSEADEKALDVVRSRKRIAYKRTRSFYQALSADVPNKEGLNAHYILIDELRAQKTRDPYDTLRYAVAARRQPLFLMVTTAGFDRHSICYEQYDYANKTPKPS